MSELPIVINVYNRPVHAANLMRSLVSALQVCIFRPRLLLVADGPRTTQEESLVVDTLAAASEGLDAAKIPYELMRFDRNIGLSKAVRAGASHVFKHCSYAMFLEDDLVVTPATLSYFQSMAKIRMRRNDVWSISAYTHPKPVWSGKSWLSRRFSSSGWATWADRWHQVDWSDAALREFVERNIYGDYSFRGYAANLVLGSDQIPTAIKTLLGTADSWAVRFSATAARLGGLHVYPPGPLIENWGWDGTGIHCPPNSDLQAVEALANVPRSAGRLQQSSWVQHLRYLRYRGVLPNRWTLQYHAQMWTDAKHQIITTE